MKPDSSHLHFILKYVLSDSIANTSSLEDRINLVESVIKKELTNTAILRKITKKIEEHKSNAENEASFFRELIEELNHKNHLIEAKNSNFQKRLEMLELHYKVQKKIIKFLTILSAILGAAAGCYSAFSS